ncbi:MAG: protein translocase subunit SecD [Sandarakinorhabdus sp.]|jgi:preprotein translocase subunit SecD|nr:protein translocase subunit SecD [Sandarakinorhabdus sp.]
MNRYPLWKYVTIVVALLIALLYALPNLYGEAPGVQVSSGQHGVRIDNATLTRIEQALAERQISAQSLALQDQTIQALFDSAETQLRARDAIDRALNPDPAQPTHVAALNLVPQTPRWLQLLNAQPMYLGLDLRGGVHFLMQVDMPGAIEQRTESLARDLRTTLREQNIRHAGVSREGQAVTVRFRDAATLEAALPTLRRNFTDLSFERQMVDGQPVLIGRLSADASSAIQTKAIQQNILTLRNRVNELGVAEPVIQQQGADRIVVQLPGVLDTARAKDILGRTATLQLRMVDESPAGRAAERGEGPVPLGSERHLDRQGRAVITLREVVLTGENLTNAQAGFDGQTQEPAVHLTLDAAGSRIFRDVTRANVGNRMAILLFERGRGEVVTAPVIRTEIGGGRVQISGQMTSLEAQSVALLLRAGALAAPMEIIEERTVGPSLGAENIRMGFESVLYGLLVVLVFIVVYYRLFGAFSSIALTFNLVLLVSVLSMLQATLTLPGMAAMALALGMAIDSNVLINERIREELRRGASPQVAINNGYDSAWGTILDSNVTSLLAGLALLAFGSGPVRGFAVVHCIGILTSMFSSVFFSRGLVNAWYGSKKKLKTISIGTVWQPPVPGAPKPGSAAAD